MERTADTRLANRQKNHTPLLSNCRSFPPWGINVLLCTHIHPQGWIGAFQTLLPRGDGGETLILHEHTQRGDPAMDKVHQQQFKLARGITTLGGEEKNTGHKQAAPVPEPKERIKRMDYPRRTSLVHDIFRTHHAHTAVVLREPTKVGSNWGRKPSPPGNAVKNCSIPPGEEKITTPGGDVFPRRT